MKNEGLMNDPPYRVAIFGSARIEEGDKIFQEVFAIAKGLAGHGFYLVTGGGPRLMAAGRGFIEKALQPSGYYDPDFSSDFTSSGH